jgi:hypothetical protein
MDFCNDHKYQAITVPLGRRAGYPEGIEWADLWKKMEVPWIMRRIEEMVKRPLTSPMFRYYFSEQEEVEEPEWAQYYAQADNVARMSAG